MRVHVCVSTRGHLLSQRARANCGVSVELSWKTAVEQSTSRSPGCHGVWAAQQ